MFGMLQYKESKKELIQYVNMHKDFFCSLNEDEFGAAKALLGGKNFLKHYQKWKKRFRRLCLRLLESGGKKELEQVFHDEDYCQELYKRYQL